MSKSSKYPVIKSFLLDLQFMTDWSICQFKYFSYAFSPLTNGIYINF